MRGRLEAELRAMGLVPIVRGIRIEPPKVNLRVAAVMLDPTHLAISLKGFEISGAENLPKSGPFLVTSTHTSALQTLMVPAAIMEVTHRSVTMVAGHTKLYPRQPENPEILALTGEKPYQEKSIAERLAVEARGYLLRNIGTIPLHRSETKRSEMRAIIDALNSGQIVGLFLNMSRNVSDIHQGVGWVASRMPNVPVIPAFSEGELWNLSPFQAVIGRPRFFRDFGDSIKNRDAIDTMNHTLHTDIQGLQSLVTTKRR